MRRDWFFLLIIICLGAALRLDLLIANNFIIDADESIVGLMANHIVAGQEIPTFYYGQHYMGSLEAILVAGLFFIFGSSAVALKIVPIFFSLILILIVFELAFQAAGRRAARLAALLCAIPPSALIVWSGMARGGFIEIVVLGAFALLLLQKWLVSSQISYKLVALTALVLGLGWWVNNQILYFMLPIAAFMSLRILFWNEKTLAIRLIDFIKVAIVGMFSWLLGGLPYWIYNIKHNWASLGMFEPARSKDILHHFNGLYEIALPILLGGSRFWQGEDIYPGSKTIVSFVYILLLLIYFALRWRNIAALFLLRIDRKHCLEVFFVFLICCSGIFVASSFGWLAQAPRYLLPMYVGIFVLSGFVLAFLIENSRLIGITLLSLLLFCNLASSYWGGRSIPGEPIVFHGDRVSKDHSEIIRWLQTNKITWIRTNYWIGYRLAFETAEQVKFIVSQEPNQTRIEDWPKQAKELAIEEMPLVMVPSQAHYVRSAFGIMNYSYQEKVLSGYHVFYNIKLPQEEFHQVASSNIIASSALNSDMANKAIDDSDETRWGSGEHQRPEMEFTLTLKEPIVIRGIRYSLGSWPQDFPRGLQIVFEKPNGERIVYFDSRGWESIRYLLQMESEVIFYTKAEEISKVIFTQTKSHPVFDWSIAEISLFK